MRIGECLSTLIKGALFNSIRNMTLPCINIFEFGELHSFQRYRDATLADMKESSGPTDILKPIGIDPVVISTPTDLVRWAISHRVEVDNFVDSQISKSPLFSTWRSAMPSRIPDVLHDYQNRHANLDDVNAAILEIKARLEYGQVLFHGGNLSQGVLARPLSTTFSPSVAINEALWKGKADRLGEVRIYVLKIMSNNVFAYVFKQKGTVHGCEKEILIASGGQISITTCMDCGEYNGRMYKVFEASLG